MDRQEDHVVGHGAEGNNDDDPDKACKHSVVDGPICDLVQELAQRFTSGEYRLILTLLLHRLRYQC